MAGLAKEGRGDLVSLALDLGKGGPAVTAWALASLLSLRRSVGAGTWEVVRVKSLSVFGLLTVRHVYACGRELR